MCAMMRAVRNADLKRRACVRRVGRYRRRRSRLKRLRRAKGGAARCEARAVSCSCCVVLCWTVWCRWCGTCLRAGGSINRFSQSQDQPQVSIAIAMSKKTDVCVWVCVVLCFALGGVRRGVKRMLLRRSSDEVNSGLSIQTRLWRQCFQNPLGLGRGMGEGGFVGVIRGWVGDDGG